MENHLGNGNQPNLLLLDGDDGENFIDDENLLTDDLEE